jgi:hypothetical protein
MSHMAVGRAATGIEGKEGPKGATGTAGIQKHIPLETGRSANMISGKVTIAAPGVTAAGPILTSAEGAIAVVGALTIAERKPGEGFVVESTLVTGTARVNWAVYSE